MLVSFYEDLDIVHVYEKLITIVDISSVIWMIILSIAHASPFLNIQLIIMLLVC